MLMLLRAVLLKHMTLDHTFSHQVLSYLDNADPEAAKIARERYSQLGSFRPEVERYVRAVHSGLVKSQAAKLEQVLKDLTAKEQEYSSLLRYVPQLPE